MGESAKKHELVTRDFGPKIRHQIRPELHKRRGTRCCCVSIAKERRIICYRSVSFVIFKLALINATEMD